jgi:hypothetical protein
MGTAPDARQPQVMPDPVRVVTKSLGLLRTLGFSRTTSLLTIVTVANQAVSDLRVIGIDDTAWLSAIADDAQRRAVFPARKADDQEGNQHGNRDGS